MMNRQSTQWEIIFANYQWDGWLITSLYIDFQKLNMKAKFLSQCCAHLLKCQCNTSAAQMLSPVLNGTSVCALEYFISLSPNGILSKVLSHANIALGKETNSERSNEPVYTSDWLKKNISCKIRYHDYKFSTMKAHSTCSQSKYMYTMIILWVILFYWTKFQRFSFSDKLNQSKILLLNLRSFSPHLPHWLQKVMS